MDVIDLPSPVPRQTELSCEPIQITTNGCRYLPKPDPTPSVGFDTVVLGRRTRRRFDTLRDDDLSRVLWYAAKIRESRPESSGFTWSHRGAPSAGGRHPIDLVLLDIANPTQEPERYDPVGHSLQKLKLANPASLQGFLEHASETVRTDRGTCICFVADTARTLSKYENGESLIWRDAGCLLATMHLIAEWCGLNFTALGPTGEPFVSEAFSQGNRVCGVGGCVLGRRPRHDPS